jgi:phenylacetate-coenzyme A ligase PaaK-like adenylate-forming protein
LFKSLKLKSIPDKEVLKTLTSSGTSNQEVSKIYIDRETAIFQTKVLASIVTSFIGTKRIPMMIIDSDATIKNSHSMSARGAGLVGLANFGRNHFYALDENMDLKLNELLEFMDKFGDGPILIFGFTFMVWQYLYVKLKELNMKINLSNGILIHSGGWKKLLEISVPNDVFKQKLFDLTSLQRVYNFYGMVEQVGSIYMECEHGYFHASNFSEILIRDQRTRKIIDKGNVGVIQTLSVIPRSYPGHSVLTEDLGEVVGTDDCACGRKGTYFLVKGRIPRAELRGCSDTHAETVSKEGMK